MMSDDSPPHTVFIMIASHLVDVSLKMFPVILDVGFFMACAHDAADDTVMLEFSWGTGEGGNR